MNKICKLFALGVIAFSTMLGSAKAQDVAEISVDAMEAAECLAVAHPDFDCGNLDIKPNKICFVANKSAFVVIDSVDNSIDMVSYQDDTLRIVGRYLVDRYTGRHDVKSILRPQSVAVFGDKIVFVASSINDSSYVGVLGMTPVASESGVDSLVCLAKVEFSCRSYALTFSPCRTEMFVAGFNPLGYNINILNVADGIENISAEDVKSLAYRVPKQAERIQQADPIGVGLTVVAVLVVFFALVCVMFLISILGNIMQKTMAKKLAVPQELATTPATTAVNSDSDVYAAIAAAIYLYQEELHDEEDTVITIQKVERAWTPWNAKFYNMNNYFNNRR